MSDQHSRHCHAFRVPKRSPVSGSKTIIISGWAASGASERAGFIPSLASTVQRRLGASKSLASIPRTPLPKRYATFLTALLLLWSIAVPAMAGSSAGGEPFSAGNFSLEAGQQQAQAPSERSSSPHEGEVVRSIELPGVGDRDRDHLLQLIPQKAGSPLKRDD